ncbi:MAG: cell division protein FtsA [Candidatus Delongbacteria bacterium]|nr:cell division protein FtsA [Candidatus Delongbacteria bacterium]
MKNQQVITVVDLGTTKYVTLIARLPEDGVPDIMGIGIEDARGMSQGTIVNMHEAAAAVARSIGMAEMMAQVKATPLVVGITGRNISSINGRGSLNLAGDRHEITEITPLALENVVQQAIPVLPGGEHILAHTLPRGFQLDGQVVQQPIGMTGYRLDADVLVVSSTASITNNIRNCMEEIGHTIDSLVLESLAAGMAVMTEGERNYGSLLIDIGGGTCDTSLYHGGHLQHVHVFPLGGERVTRDLAEVLSTSLDDAEELKIIYGHASPRVISEDRRIRVPLLNSSSTQEYTLSYIASIIECRLREYFEHNLAVLEQSRFVRMLEAGVVLTGGGSLLPGIREVAEEIFQRSVRIGEPANLPGIHDRLNQPRHTVAIGLILYTAARLGRLSGELVRKIGNPLLTADIPNDRARQGEKRLQGFWQRMMRKVAL